MVQARPPHTRRLSRSFRRGRGARSGVLSASRLNNAVRRRWCGRRDSSGLGVVVQVCGRATGNAPPAFKEAGVCRACPWPGKSEALNTKRQWGGRQRIGGPRPMAAAPCCRRTLSCPAGSGCATGSGCKAQLPRVHACTLAVVGRHMRCGCRFGSGSIEAPPSSQARRGQANCLARKDQGLGLEGKRALPRNARCRQGDCPPLAAVLGVTA
jgi:hypothetical protein